MVSFVFFLLLFCILVASMKPSSLAMEITDVLSAPHSLSFGNSLVSPSQVFEFGFFTTKNSSNNFTYLGIWFKNLDRSPKPIWIANRNNPITGMIGTLVVKKDSRVLLYNGCGNQVQDSIIWFINPKRKAISPSLQLLDSGNLVLIDKNGDDPDGLYLWESFDHPTNVFLSGMKLKTGLQRRITAWKSDDDPSVGDYSFGLEQPETGELVLRNGSDIISRWGLWDEKSFNFSDYSNPIFQPVFVSNNHLEVYFLFKSTHLMFLINPHGQIQYLKWSKQIKKWETIMSLPNDSCDEYSRCGPNKNCYITDNGEPECRCLDGFEEKSNGCERKWEVKGCGEGDWFVKVGNVKLPDKGRMMRMEDEEEGCQEACLKNCSCTGYAEVDVGGKGNECVFWAGDLFDLRNYPLGGHDIFVRMAKQQLGTNFLITLTIYVL